MGRINKYSNGDRVNQHRKSQGKFLEKQDIESYLFSKKLNNGNNIQGKNTLNTDDLPNIPAILDYALNLPTQGSIKHIDGGTAHTPMAQALLPILTALSTVSAAPAIFPNITASSNKAISTDNQNSLLARVTSPTGKMPILFDTTPATTSTSQNHDQSLIRGKRAAGDGLIRHNADGNVILGNDGQKLTFSHHLDIDMLKQQLTNSNITELCLWAVKIDPQKAQEIGEILKGSKVEVLSILHSSIRNIGAIDFGTMLTGTEVTRLNLAYNGIGDEKAIGFIKSLKKGSTKVKALDLSSNNMSDKGVNDIIPELVGTKIIEMDIDRGIERNTLKKLLKVLKQNRQVNKESTSTIKSSTTEGESSTTEKKREKRDIHTTNESTEDTTVLKEEPTTTVKSTVPTTDVSSTNATESTATSTSTTAPITLKSSTTTTESTAASTSTTAKEEPTTTTVKSTVLTTDVSSTTATESTAASTSTTTEQETIPLITEEFSTTIKRGTASSTEGSATTEQETIPPITEEFSTTTKRVTTSSAEDSTTTEQETTVPTVEKSSTTTMEVTTSSPIEDSTTPEKKTTTPIMEKSSTTTKRVTTSSTEGSATTEQETTVPTTDGSSTTTTKSTASSAGNPTTDSATVWSNPQKTTTPKKNLTEKSEPIAADVVVDSITEKHTPKESNPNDPASSTMSTKEILALISFVLTAVSIGGGVAICVVKKFFDGASRLGHNALALADLALVELDNCLDNNHEETPLAGVTVVTVDDNANI